MEVSGAKLMLHARGMVGSVVNAELNAESFACELRQFFYLSFPFGEGIFNSFTASFSTLSRFGTMYVW
jgi:nucleoside recognition membrane protein YjiH